MILVSGGMVRSGSTVTYQCACKVVESLGIGKCAGYAWSEKAECYKQFPQLVKSNQWNVIKRHAWHKRFELAGDRLRVLIPIRDLRDVGVSLKHFFDTDLPEFPKVPLIQFQSWPDNVPRDRLAIFRYEDYILGDNITKLPYLIAHFLDVEISDEMARQIASECSLESNKERLTKVQSEKDEYGFVPDRHIHCPYPGSRKELSKDELGRILRLGGKFMKEWGYL